MGTLDFNSGSINITATNFAGDGFIKLAPNSTDIGALTTTAGANTDSRALAGLRVGYALGDAGLVQALTRVKDSFNSYPLGRPAQAGAIASLEDEAHFQQSRTAVMRGRDELGAALARLGFEVLPSQANFVFARHPGRSGQALAAALRERAVLVRHFTAPRIADYLRITVGSGSDLARLIEALRNILAAPR